MKTTLLHWFYKQRLILGLKIDGIWNKLDYLKIKVNGKIISIK